jgi:hypothetical protein
LESSRNEFQSDGLRLRKSSSIPGVAKGFIQEPGDPLCGRVGVWGSGGGVSRGLGGEFGANKGCPPLFAVGLEGGGFTASKACPPLLAGGGLAGAADPEGWDISALRCRINICRNLCGE